MPTAVGHELLDDPEVRERLVDRFGAGVLARRGLEPGAAPGSIGGHWAAIVFADPEARRGLEAIVHPLMRARFVEAIEREMQAGRDQARSVVLDAAILLEAGWDDLCDLVVFVDAPRAERMRRGADQRGWSAETFDARERAQWPCDEKRRRAALVIANDAGVDSLRREVDAARHPAGGRSSFRRRSSPAVPAGRFRATDRLRRLARSPNGWSLTHPRRPEVTSSPRRDRATTHSGLLHVSRLNRRMDPMANETRPRRESSGTSRIRKTIPSTAAPSAGRTRRRGHGCGPGLSRRGRVARRPRSRASATARTASRTAKRPRRIASRSGSSASATASRCENGPSASRVRARAGALGAGTAGTRPRRARRRPDPPRGNPDGSGPRPRPRSRRRDAAVAAGADSAMPEPGADFRDRTDREASLSRSRDRDRDYSPPVRAERPRRRAMSISLPTIPTKRKTSSATPPSTTATRTSSAARSISPSFRR